MFRIESLLCKTLAVKLHLDHKLGRPDLLFVELFPQFPERISVQRPGLRVIIGIADTFQFAAKQQVFVPGRGVSALPVGCDQGIQLRQNADAGLLTAGKKPGRGAYICANADCLAKAQKSKGLERSFKAAVPKEVYEQLLREMEEGTDA